MNTVQRILKNMASLLISGAIAQSLTFVSIVYLARVLGPGDFGKINFALAIVVYFILIANMGLPLLGTREIAREKDRIKDYLGSILALRLSLAVLGFSLLLLMTFFLNKPLEIRYLIILYGLGLIPSALLLDWAFQGVEKMEYIGLGRILAAVIYVGLVLWFVKGHQQLLLIPCLHVVANLLSAGLLISIFVRHFGKPKFSFNLAFWKGLLRQALPIGVSIIMIQVIYHIDTVMLGFMKGNKEVGHYNAAYKIILLLIMAGSTYFDTIFPLISSYYKTSLDSLRKLQFYTAKVGVTLALPLALGGTILAKPIMNLTYGVKYGEGVVGLQILIWVVALIYINMVYGRGLWACQKQNKYLMIVTFQALVNIVTNFVLIPPLGLKGAAISTMLAEAVGVFFYYGEFNKIVRVPFHNHVLKPAIASMLMALFLLWGVNKGNLHVISLILGGITIYFMFLYLLGGIKLEEVRLLQDAIIKKGSVVQN